MENKAAVLMVVVNSAGAKYIHMQNVHVLLIPQPPTFPRPNHHPPPPHHHHQQQQQPITSPSSQQNQRTSDHENKYTCRKLGDKNAAS